MTALTVPVRPAEDARLRPLPWRRMAWVTWRHHRIALSGVAVLLGGLAVWLWIAGLQLHHAYAAALACHPAGSAACTDLFLNFNALNGILKSGLFLQPLPPLIGAFVGAPVLAREIETGTFRYAWTQGFARWRWALAKLVPIAVAVAVAAGAFSVLVSWYYQPYIATGTSPLSPVLFDLRGIAFAAWTLTAFAIGALAGMLIRRVVPSIVATLAIYTGLALAAGIVLRHTRWANDHPASHFWPLQWIEGGCLLALSALLVAIAVWLVHHRAA
jgi:ABC-2 family transporter protein